MHRAFLLTALLAWQRVEPFRVMLSAEADTAVAGELLELKLQVDVAADTDLPQSLLSGCEVVLAMDGAESRPVFPGGGAAGKVRVARGTRIARTLAVPVGQKAGTARLSWAGIAGAEVTVRVLEPMRDVPVAALDLALTRVILLTSCGTIELSLRPDVAPEHARSFVQLCRDGFYDGTRFHRVVKGLLAQGGDPNSRDEDAANDGTGGPGFRLKAEFNDLPHERGVLSMARDPKDPDSAGSQFFLLQGKVPAYDRQYTVFGRIERGLEALDRICAVRVRPRVPNAPADLPDSDVWLKRALVLGARR